MTKVLLIYGGASEEYDVSCRSAKAIIENIDRDKFELECVNITKNNEWLYDNKRIDNIVEFIKKFDVVFPIIHGTDGEDGKLQGFLDLFRIKYVGSNLGSSFICMDKEYSKIIFEKLGLPIVPYQVIDSVDEITIPYPVIVKPANCGSSIGISKANNDQELKEAIKLAKEYDNKVIVEKFVMAQELECAVLETKEGLIVSNIGEIKTNSSFYDYEAKYESDIIQTVIKADISINTSDKIKEYAEKLFKKLNLKGLSRIDFFYDKEKDKIYINEINTLPGFTSISMYPMLIMDQGISYKDLITILIENAK